MTAVMLKPGHSLARSAFVIRLSRYIELDDEDLSDLAHTIQESAHIKRRSDLVIEGYQYRKLCFVEEGFAARYKLLRNGKRQILDVILPGDVVGMPGSFFDRACYSVVALADLTLLACSIDSFVQLCYRRPKFGLALSWLAVEEAAIYAEHIIDIGRRRPLERLAHFLLELHARLRVVNRAAESGFELPFSQELMADVLGLSVPHLNRMMRQLRTDGLVASQDRHVDFVDRAGLQALAHYQPLQLARIPARADASG
jgi:CRP-like cAMP-binding protein